MSDYYSSLADRALAAVDLPDSATITITKLEFATCDDAALRELVRERMKAPAEDYEYVWSDELNAFHRRLTHKPMDAMG